MEGRKNRRKNGRKEKGREGEGRETYVREFENKPFIRCLIYFITHNFLKDDLECHLTQKRNLSPIQDFYSIDQHLQVLYLVPCCKCLTTGSLRGKVPIYSICWLPWCKYSHGGPLRATQVRSLNTELAKICTIRWYSHHTDTQIAVNNTVSINNGQTQWNN